MILKGCNEALHMVLLNSTGRSLLTLLEGVIVSEI